MNKGDYIPRSNVGGPAALKEGIAALHEKRGNSATRRGVSTPIRSKARARRATPAHGTLHIAAPSWRTLRGHKFR